MTDQTRPYYVPVGHEDKVFRAAFHQGLSILLKGPTGCGKTRFVESMAYDLERPLVTVSCHDDLTTADLVGRYLLQGGDTAWVDGPLTRAVRQGAICYLDEIVEARQDTTVVLHPLGDHRRQLPIDRLGVTLDAAPGFCLVVSYNPGYQSVLKDLKDSTRQRMIAIELDFPPADVEEKVVAHEAGVGHDVAAQLVQLGQVIRRLENAGLREVASTRVLIAAGRLAQGRPECSGCGSGRHRRSAHRRPGRHRRTVRADRCLRDRSRAASMSSLVVDLRTCRALASEQVLGSVRRVSVGRRSLEQGNRVSYESHAEPIKLGYLFDFKLPDGYPDEMRKDLTRPFELVFQEGLERGIIDRPVEIVFREVEGLPKGTVKAVIDAYAELVDEGCLVIFGPAITDNCVPTREAIEERFHVPAMSMTGTDDWLGEWTFSLPQGSLTDEPMFWADLDREGRLHDGWRARRAVTRR